MKKIALIFVSGMLLFFAGCGPGKNEAEELRGNTAKSDTADTASAKTNFNDPLAPPSPDYSGDHVVKYKHTDITQFRGFFRFGKRHGTWTSFYPTGEVWTENEYDNGVQHGFTKVYYKNGKLQYEGSFSKGEKSGTWKFYDETGKLIQEEKF